MKKIINHQSKIINIIFWGTPDFVLPIPQALLNTEGYKLSAVITAPDKPTGRRHLPTPSPVKTWAQTHQIPVLTPEKLDKNFQSEIINHKSDLFILAAYGKILPPEILKIPKYGSLCIHPSLLPQYRGPSPVQATILAGDSQTGVTIIKMDEKVDHGSIISQFTEPIGPDDTAETLYARLFQMAAEVLVTILPAWVEGRIKPREQDHSKATYTKILRREDGYLNLENPPAPEMFDRLVRALHPWPGVWGKFKVKSSKLKVIKFLPENKIQVEGGKPMTLADFLNGYPEAKEWLSKLLSS